MNDIKKAYEKTEEVGRKIWLAGLGAYGQSFDNVQNGYERINNETRGFFEKLVARGEELENQTRNAIKNTGENALKKTGNKFKQQGEKLIERGDKIQEIDNLGLESISNNINHRLDEIRSKVSEVLPRMVNREALTVLNQKIDKLTDSIEAVPSQPTAARPRTAPAKTTQTRKVPEAAETTEKTTQTKSSRTKTVETK